MIEKGSLQKKKIIETGWEALHFWLFLLNSPKIDFQSRANFSPQKEKNITILKNFKSFIQIYEMGGGECFLSQGDK